MSRTGSNTSLPSRDPSYSRLAKNPLWNKKNQLESRKIDEEGDAESVDSKSSKSSLCPLSLQNDNKSTASRQRSDPVLSRASASKVSVVRRTAKSARAESNRPSTARKSSSLDSNITVDKEPVSEKPPGTPEEERVCEVFKTDHQLRSLCTAIGLSLHPDTLVGPIEKGQLIIGVLQDSLNDLIKLKVRKAAKKGDIFHIQQSGLDLAIRALENADRSLRTMKASREPILGRRTPDQSIVELVLQEQKKSDLQQKQTDRVIRILSSAKEKFDKMGNGLGRFMTGLTFLSPRSGTSTLPSSAIPTTATSRRTSGISLLTTPATPRNTAKSTRAKSSTSSTSVGSRNGNKRLMSAILF